MNKETAAVEFEVDSQNEGRLLQKYLEGHRGLSSKAIKKLKHQGAVLLNGQRTLMNVRLRAGDRISLIYPPQKPSPYLVPEALPLEICYEDKDVLVVEKSPKQCVHPTKGHPGQTLANGVLYHWQEKGDEASLHLIYRLDQDTSGLILIAKNYHAAQQLFNQQRDKGIVKKYAALVEGRIAEESGTIDLPIARVEGRTTKRLIAAEGARAVTRFQVKGYYQSPRGEDYTHVAIVLETGRTHQIRVHFSHLGHPLAGDAFYGGMQREGLERQFLHVDYLTFTHPLNQEKLEFTSKLPQDLASFLQGLKLHT